MAYIALLRGVNVGGKGMVSMAALKTCLTKLGFTQVTTYINSGNILFSVSGTNTVKLTNQIERVLTTNFGGNIRVLVTTRETLHGIATATPDDWVNDAAIKCDVFFLWPEIDHPNILGKLPIQSEVDEVQYVPGAVVWRVDRSNTAKSRIDRFTGTALYKQMTVRNINTVRKLVALADAID